MMLRPRQKLFVERSIRALDEHGKSTTRPVSRMLMQKSS
jgi:hypothetical protein